MFDFYKTLDLSYIGSEWKDCYLKFHSFTAKELETIDKINADISSKDATEISLSLLKEKFVEGYAIKGGKREEFTKEDLDQLPVELIGEAMKIFNPTLDKKKVNQSPMPSGESVEPSPQ